MGVGTDNFWGLALRAYIMGATGSTGGHLRPAGHTAVSIRRRYLLVITGSALIIRSACITVRHSVATDNARLFILGWYFLVIAAGTLIVRCTGQAVRHSIMTVYAALEVGSVNLRRCALKAYADSILQDLVACALSALVVTSALLAVRYKLGTSFTLAAVGGGIIVGIALRAYIMGATDSTVGHKRSAKSTISSGCSSGLA